MGNGASLARHRAHPRLYDVVEYDNASDVTANRSGGVARRGAQDDVTEADGKTGAATTSVRAALGQILAYVWRYPRAALIVFLLIVLDVAFNTVLSLSPQFVIDFAIIPNNRRVLVIIIVGLAVGFVAVAASQIWRDYLYAWLGARVLNDLRTDILEHLQILSLDFFARRKLGDLLARFSTDLGAVENAIVFGLPGFLYAFLHVAVSLSVLFEHCNGVSPSLF